MDIKDRSGDPASFMHRFQPTSLAVVAFILQFLGLALLASQAHRLGETIILGIMTASIVISGVCWFKLSRYKYAIRFMKVPFFVGLYFLT
jgi:hypothetical protein